jgi:hypothetical protein
MTTWLHHRLQACASGHYFENLPVGHIAEFFALLGGVKEPGWLNGSVSGWARNLPTICGTSGEVMGAAAASQAASDIRKVMIVRTVL